MLIAPPVIVWEMHHRSTGRRAACMLLRVGQGQFDVLMIDDDATSVGPFPFGSTEDAAVFTAHLSYELTQLGWTDVDSW